MMTLDHEGGTFGFFLMVAKGLLDNMMAVELST